MVEANSIPRYITSNYRQNRVMVLLLTFILSCLAVPYGSIYPTEIGFYSGLGTAVGVTAIMYLLLMKLNLSGPVRRMFLLNRFLLFALSAIMFMLFLPKGSFDPTTFGFYRAIFHAAGLQILFTFLMKSPPVDAEILKTKHPLA